MWEAGTGIKEGADRERWKGDRTFQKEEQYVWKQSGMKQYDVFENYV